MEVFLTSTNVTEEDVAGRTVVVIDVLRASASIITALKNGARAVVPVVDMADAGKIASALDQESYRLGGERGGERIEGYHLGNSPLEYANGEVTGRTIIFNTTNGSGAIARSKAAQHLLVGSFLNAERVVAFLREVDTEIAIVCAGQRNRVSLEDTLCAGLLLYRLWDGQVPERVSDAAYMAFTQYRNDKDNLSAAIRHCNHAQWLCAHGYEDDVEFCLQVDALPYLPYHKENRLVLFEPAFLEAGAEEG